MKKFMVLSCMLISMSMTNAMEQNGETGKKIKQEIPLITLMDYYLPGMSPQSAEQRYLVLQKPSSTNSTNIRQGITSPKPERTLP